MRSLATIVLLLSFVLSGCTASNTGSVGGATTGADLTENFNELKVSATTGGIRGVVVDPSIAPIAQAKVALALKTGNQTSTSDKMGRFTFTDLAPGTYFLSINHPLYRPQQTTVEVAAGVADPQVTKVQLTPLFSQKPYTVQIKHKGFFQCSQAGVGLYSSSNCVTDYCPIVQDPKTCNTLPTNALNNVTSQQREWHADVGSGWQNQVFEMTWTPSSQGTSANMGLTVSTYKPERNPKHWFASVESANPLRLQLDVGKAHPNASGVDPTNISADGMSRMSFFASVRKDAAGATCGLSCPPAVAVNQEFEVFLTQFYYGFAPTDWSFVRGNQVPF